MDTGLGRGLLEIAMGFLAIGLIALLINKAPQTVQVTNAAVTGFDSLLRTVTLQNSMGGLQF